MLNQSKPCCGIVVVRNQVAPQQSWRCSHELPKYPLLDVGPFRSELSFETRLEVPLERGGAAVAGSPGSSANTSSTG